jgi:hypothetical protein
MSTPDIQAGQDGSIIDLSRWGRNASRFEIGRPGDELAPAQSRP